MTSFFPAVAASHSLPVASSAIFLPSPPRRQTNPTDWFGNDVSVCRVQFRLRHQTLRAIATYCLSANPWLSGASRNVLTPVQRQSISIRVDIETVHNIDGKLVSKWYINDDALVGFRCQAGSGDEIQHRLIQSAIYLRYTEPHFDSLPRADVDGCIQKICRHSINDNTEGR